MLGKRVRPIIEEDLHAEMGAGIADDIVVEATDCMVEGCLDIEGNKVVALIDHPK